MDAILVTFRHAAENAQLYQIILRGEGATQASRRLHAIIRQKAAELVSERCGGLPSDGDDALRDGSANYVAAAFSSPLPSREEIPRSLKICSFRRSDRNAAMVAFTTFA